MCSFIAWSGSYRGDIYQLDRHALRVWGHPGPHRVTNCYNGQVSVQLTRANGVGEGHGLCMEQKQQTTRRKSQLAAGGNTHLLSQPHNHCWVAGAGSTSSWQRCKPHCKLTEQRGSSGGGCCCGHGHWLDAHGLDDLWHLGGLLRGLRGLLGGGADNKAAPAGGNGRAGGGNSPAGQHCAGHGDESVCVGSVKARCRNRCCCWKALMSWSGWMQLYRASQGQPSCPGPYT